MHEFPRIKKKKTTRKNFRKQKQRLNLIDIQVMKNISQLHVILTWLVSAFWFANSALIIAMTLLISYLCLVHCASFLYHFEVSQFHVAREKNDLTALLFVKIESKYLTWNCYYSLNEKTIHSNIFYLTSNICRLLWIYIYIVCCTGIARKLIPPLRSSS